MLEHAFTPQSLDATSRPLDTDVAAWQMQLQIWRRMSAETKLRIVFELSENMRELAVAGAKQRLPHATPEEIQTAVARQMLGDELWQQAYGPTANRVST